MKVSIAQIATVVGDFEDTVGKMVRYAKQACAQGSKLIVYPYATLTGSQSQFFDEAVSEHFLDDAVHALYDFSQQIKHLEIAALVPLSYQTESSLITDAVLVHYGDLTPIRSACLARAMQQLTEDKDSDSEDDYYLSDNGVAIFTVDGARCGVVFTVDEMDQHLDTDEKLDMLIFIPFDSFIYSDANAQLAVGLGANDYFEEVDTLGYPMVCASGVGGYGEDIFPGSSFIIAPHQTVISIGPFLEEALVTGETAQTESLPSHLTWEIGAPVEPMLYDALVTGTTDLVRQQGFETVAVRVDGSLASLLLVCLAVDAVGPLNVRALVCSDDPETKSVITNLRVDARTPDFRLPIPQPHAWARYTDELLQSVQEAFLAELARENDSLILLADDKTSLALGKGSTLRYPYLWAPFGDLFMNEVLNLAQTRNEMSPVIPQACFGRYGCPWLDGFESLGANDRERLEQFDSILLMRVELGMDFEEISSYFEDPSVVRGVLDLLDQATMAHFTVPPTFALSDRMLRDYASSLGVAWHDHARKNQGTLDIQSLLKKVIDAINEDDSGRQRPLNEMKAFQDALDMIRDMSERQDDEREDQDNGNDNGVNIDLGNGLNFRTGLSGWENPFSEN